MRRLVMLLAACMGVGEAWADGQDPLFEGRDLLGGGEHERGVALLRGVIAEGQAAPKDAGKQLRAGRAHYYLEEGALAVAALERARALEPKEVRYAFWLGRAALAVDTPKALAAFQEAVALDAKDADSWYGLGMARERAQDAAGALDAYRRVLALDAAYSGAGYRAARVLHELGRGEEALPLLRKELAEDPTYVDAGTLLAFLEHRAGRYEKALDALRAVAPHAGGSIYLRSRMVMALFALGRHADAEPLRAEIRKLHAETNDPKVRALTEFCIDEFVVDDARVVVYEQFDRSPEALVWYAFRAYRGETRTLQVNLEPGPVAPELGIPGGDFLLGAYDDVGHRTFDKRWLEEPPYPELKAAVADALRGRLAVLSRMQRRAAVPDSPK